MKYKINDIVEWKIAGAIPEEDVIGIGRITQIQKLEGDRIYSYWFDWPNISSIAIPYVYKKEIIRKLTESEMTFWILTR